MVAAQSVKEILGDACTDVRRDSSSFWIIAAALKKFLDSTGVLPLSGAIPDMTATTECASHLSLLSYRLLFEQVLLESAKHLLRQSG